MKKKVAPSKAPAFEYLYTVEWDTEEDKTPQLVRARIKSISATYVFITGRPYVGFHCKARIPADCVGQEDSRYYYDPAEAWVHFLDNQRDGHRLDLARAIRRERVMTMTPPPVEDAE